MFTGKFIKNIIFDGEHVHAIGRRGSPTRVFAMQGDLDGSCSIYCLMMMLIFHQKLDWGDLTNNAEVKDNQFVHRTQQQFLYHLKGLCIGGHVMDEVSNKLNLCLGENLSEAFTTIPGRNNYLSRQELHLKIRAQLDARKPVMLGFSREKGKGHAVVAIGYRKEEWNRLRLFCLDPGHKLPFMQIWNNVIDLDYLSNDDEALTDINHYEDNKVYVSDILIIHDKPTKFDCPF